MSEVSPVLILGAGVNGACTARELVLNGIPVWIVDRYDISYGATAKSSRLIHGGLRYLEYGDTALVHESLNERARLLKLAPQFVTPLKLYIPIRKRFGGLFSAGLKFTRLTRTRLGAKAAKVLGGERGLETVRMGLRMYDFLSRGGGLPGHTVVRVGKAGPRVDENQYSWMACYYDAQIRWPERFTLALLEDTRRLAAEKGVEFKVLTHTRARLENGQVTLTPDIASAGEAPLTLKPANIVNATGAWGDHTLKDLPAPTKRLFGGTKGSHIFTRQPALVKALQGEAVYAEAPDGRLVFILPFGESVLIGTTDERFETTPDQAVCTDTERDYLVGMVNDVFPNISLTPADVDAHYSGVRPLPYQADGTTGSIPRGHWIETTTCGGITIDTLIGGKLTTCRQLGEEAADRVLSRLMATRKATTQDRPIPGADHLTTDPETHQTLWKQIAQSTGFSLETVQATGLLTGSRASEFLSGLDSASDRELVHGTCFPEGVVARIVASEWVSTLEDLVERRLMLTTAPTVAEQTLRELARFIPGDQPEAVDGWIAGCRDRLKKYYGIKVV